MLLTVEGGGFFSSSAIICSKGLTLLLDKSEEKPMRVAPLSQYDFAEEEPFPDLASLKKRCASFVCFGCAGIDASTPLNLDLAKQEEERNPLPLASLKSSMKRKLNQCVENLGEVSSDGRKVQWTDVCGRELVQIKEFDPSETSGSDDDENKKNLKRSICVIM